MEHAHPINEMMATTIEKVKELVDANTIIGQPIQSGEITLIPVSRVSIGFGTGGTELADGSQQQEKKTIFGGGGGAGVKVEPVAFIVVNGHSTKVLPMAVPADSTVERIVELVPDLIDKVTDYIDKKSKEKESLKG